MVLGLVVLWRWWLYWYLRNVTLLGSASGSPIKWSNMYSSKPNVLEIQLPVMEIPKVTRSNVDGFPNPV